MKREERQNNAGRPDLPIMLFDGDCGFCRYWIGKWRGITRGKVRYEPYQKVLAQYPQVTREQCRTAVQLIMPDGTAFSAARAVFLSLAAAGRWGFLAQSYRRFPFFARVSEALYRFVARHRAFFSRLMRIPQCDL